MEVVEPLPSRPLATVASLVIWVLDPVITGGEKENTKSVFERGKQVWH